MSAEVVSDEPYDDTPEADDPEDAALDVVQGVVRYELEAFAAEFGDASGESGRCPRARKCCPTPRPDA